MEHAAVAVENLVVRKKRHVILDSLTFSVGKGSITGLIGPSGSGKTTLMRSLVGVQTIGGGTVTIGGLPAGSRQLRSKIGYVTQAPAIYKDLSVQQNLAYFGSVFGASKDRVGRIIEEVELVPQKDQLAGSLSGGQQTRVSLAIALLGEPELLVLDEPTVGLDPLLRDSLWRHFRSLSAADKTLIVSSHVMDEAERCDRLLFLREGRLLADATPQTLEKHGGSLETAFIQLSRKAGGGS